MLRHIVTWNYRPEFTLEENRQNAEIVKIELESLKQNIGGIIELDFHIDPLPTSNKDVCLDSLFESKEALTEYKVHPEHIRVGEFITSVFQDRVAFDFIV